MISGTSSPPKAPDDRTAEPSFHYLAAAPRSALKPIRREMQLIFQDPFSSLDPRMTLFDIIGEPLKVNGVGNYQERVERVTELLRLVGLRPEYIRRLMLDLQGRFVRCHRAREITLPGIDSPDMARA